MSGTINARRLAELLAAEGGVKGTEKPMHFRRLVATSEVLGPMLGIDVFDSRGAAVFVGVTEDSIRMAAYRRRLPFVQFGPGRVFTRYDLLRYAKARGTGRASRLRRSAAYAVVGGRVIPLPTDG